MFLSKLKISLAFSLVEVIIALVILAILASAVLIPLRNSMEAASLRSAADRVMADLHLVRTAARREQTPRTIVFTPVSCTYAAPEVTDPETRQPLSVALHNYHIDRVTLTGCNVDFEIAFDAQGFTAAAVTIVLKTGGRTHTIQVHTTGDIEQVN